MTGASSLASKSGSVMTKAAAPRGLARLTTDVVHRCADEAVAGDEVMVEERQRLVGRKRGQPEREPRQLHCHRIQVHAEQASHATSRRGRALRRRDVARMPVPSRISVLFDRIGEITARGDEKRAASHRRIENPEREKVIARSAGGQWSERVAHEVIGDGPRRVERAGRLPCVARAIEHRGAATAAGSYSSTCS